MWGPEGEWVPYGTEVSRLLEDAHEDHQKYFSFCVRGVPIQVYLQSRKQINLLTNEEAELQRTMPHIEFVTLSPNEPKATLLTPQEKKMQEKLLKAGTYTKKEYQQLMATGMLTHIEKDWKVELPAQAYTAEEDIARVEAFGQAEGSRTRGGQHLEHALDGRSNHHCRHAHGGAPSPLERYPRPHDSCIRRSCSERCSPHD